MNTRNFHRWSFLIVLIILGTLTAPLAGRFLRPNPSAIAPMLTCSADFSYSANQLSVTFTDQSAASPGAIVSWDWRFGDGNTSTLQNPSHTYASPGSYVVELQIFTSDSCYDVFADTVQVSCPPPVGAFSFAINGLDLNLTDQSSPTTTSWFWDFGDSNTDTVQNPTHRYNNPGQYLVCLTAINACGIDDTCLTVSVCDCRPKMKLKVNLNRCPVIHFEDSSLAIGDSIISRAWNFGDGDSSGFTNPVHIFSKGDTHIVCLKVQASNGGTAEICDTLFFPENARNTKANSQFTPLAWIPKLADYPMDADSDFVEDTLRGLTTPADLILCLNRCLEVPDSLFFSQFGTVGYVGKYVSLVQLKGVPISDLDTLAQHPSVAMVSWDAPVEANLNTSLQAMKVLGSSAYSPNTLADAYPGLDGKGVSIGIIDSGVDDGQHEDLPASKFVGGFDAFRNVETNPDDDNGHGTHVAGIALGIGKNSPYRGVAPGADLVDIKVLDANGQGTQSGIIAGIEKCIQRRNQWNIGVINMSLGAFHPLMRDNGTHPTSVVTDRAVANGISVIVAAGNSGPLPLSIGIPGTATDALTVGSAYDLTTVNRVDDIVSVFSSRGPRIDGFQKPEVTAYGQDITAPRHNTTNGYVTLSGTSMAAPHVAGLAALMLQLNPKLPPLAIKSTIIQGVEKRTPIWDTSWGNGLVDAYATMTLVAAPGTDLGFVDYCNKPGVVSWGNITELAPSNPIIRENVPNTINIKITNFGPLAATAFKVRASVYNFGNGDNAFPLIDQTITTPLPAGQSTTISVPWTPKLSPGTGSVHACMKADVIFAHDLDQRNNCVARNIDIQRANSPAVFLVDLRNPMEEDILMELDMMMPPNSGWEISPNDTIITFEEQRCPMPLRIYLNPVTAPIGDTITVPVAVNALYLPDSVRCNIGGITLVAVYDTSTALDPFPYPFSDPLLEVYPNPTSGTVHLRFRQPREGLVRVDLLDLQGRRLQTILETWQQEGVHTHDFALPAWPGGVYFIRLSSGAHIGVRKLVLIK